jgi:peptidoglycan-associated lipoprotein
MRHRYAVPSVLFVVLIAVLGVTGCKPKPVETPPTVDAQPDTDPGTDSTRTERRTEPTPVDSGGWDNQGEVEEFDPDKEISVEQLQELARQNLRTVFFAYDSFDLTSSSQTTLQENARWLKAYPDLAIVIEGHCDERGTIEYNLALGEKRANTVRDYLTTLGVNRSRIRVVTYGEERPIAEGHQESAWSRNRRAEFKVD